MYYLQIECFLLLLFAEPNNTTFAVLTPAALGLLLLASTQTFHFVLVLSLLNTKKEE